MKSEGEIKIRFSEYDYRLEDDYQLEDDYSPEDDYRLKDNIRQEDDYILEDDYRLKDNIRQEDNYLLEDDYQLEDDYSPEDYFRLEDDFWQGNDGKIKKRLPRRTITIAIVALMLILLTNAVLGDGEELRLNVVPVSRGHVMETHSVNGMIESERTQVFHSPVNAPISELNFQVGDTVRTGDVIIMYDLENIDFQYEQSMLQLATTRYGNQATIEMSENDQERHANDVQRQNTHINNVRREIAELEDEIDRLRNIEEAQERDINQRIDEIQDERLENRGEFSQIFAERSGLTLELQDEDTTAGERARIRTEIADIEAEMVILDDELRVLDNELESKRMEVLTISSDERIMAQQELTNLRLLLSNLETAPSLPVMNPELTSGQIYSMQVTEELLELSLLSAQELLERATEGVRAEFDGIISNMSVSQGSVAVQGGALLTIVSNQDIVVKLEIPASDFDRVVIGNEATIQLGNRDYLGTVERVNRVAVPNALGQMVIEATVSIDNPDDDIFVGVPVRVILTVEEVFNVLYLPPEVVNMTALGHFVYVIVDNVVERRLVEVGIASSHQVEIISGVEYGELVVSDASIIDLEGMQVVPLLME
jgi:multidrug efflux pump subunit AcrA (membrane-fusion protein)